MAQNKYVWKENKMDSASLKDDSASHMKIVIELGELDEQLGESVEGCLGLGESVEGCLGLGESVLGLGESGRETPNPSS